ncbi:TonB-dependent receptor [Sphingomonas sp. H39-1-10]|uniref:TonB-dependent receptor n=1 Tax=Sphingomonas pollutisoli TaxID=3030829 RepID=UPI0023B9E292|nr:TonB-dependent receptor [Sphingomonas pollutisoli]MDF0487327.1 TonB-dependent receptor [Sphingomonas pollutisoli]
MAGTFQKTSAWLHCTSGAALMIAAGLALPAHAQTSAEDGGSRPVATPPSDAEVQDIVVTGFRASLDSALNLKRSQTAAVDSIVAEDIGKFPDSNLAESMQRIPGVALARGDGGEGKNISVRGLGAQFTRVRINGMEGTSQTGSSDIYGAGNTGRSFDFNVFPTEIFSSLSVRKTPSADIEEGSLGATVDLAAPHPLDQKDDFVAAATGRAIYGEISKRADPRVSALISKKFGEGRFGILGSVAYNQRHLREVGYSAVDILSANTNGGFCSPIGAPINTAGQTPAQLALRGVTATNCSTNNPRTGSLSAYNAIVNARRADAPNTPGSGAFFPRIPRYLNSTQSQERIAGTLTLQFKDGDDTDISLDLLYSRFHVIRDDNYLGAISFGRSASNDGQPMTSVTDLQLSSLGSVQYGAFNGVDIRSEGLHADFTSTFKQANLNFMHRFTDRLKITGKFGLNQSVFDDHQRVQYFMDAIDKGFTLDYRKGGTTPLLGFGFDVTDPANFNYAPGLADGTVLGGFSLQGKPATTTTDGYLAEFEAEWEINDALTLRGGAQYRQSKQSGIDTRYYTADTLVKPLPAGTSLASISSRITDFGALWGNGAPASWATLDWKKLYDTANLGASRSCTIECGSPKPIVREEEKSAFAMGVFDLTDTIGFGVRGDVGVRYINTLQFSSGYVSTASAASPTGVTGLYGAVTRSYDDWLPSANIVFEPIRNLLLRVSGAKVMSRPELGVLTPTSGVNPVTRTGTVNNPLLEPIRANTFDAALEWYFRPGSLLSAAFFYKDIKTYIQSVTSLVPYTDLGLPVALLDGSNTQPTELFSVTRPVNTPGGKLKGVEINAQVPFSFLPGVLSNFGALGNYTHVTSRINYCLTSVAGVCTVTTTNDLVGLSKNTASGTLYYEDRRFSIRGTINYRGPFIRGIPASAGSDLQGNAQTTYVDASASYNITENFKLIIEAQNLTDEQNRLYTDSQRKDTLYQTRVGRTFAVGVNARF